MRTKLAAEEGISSIGYTYWNISPTDKVLEAVSEADKGSIGHSGEAETSLQLYLQPELVDMNAAVWTLGVSGDPTKGSREKGKRIVDAAVGALVKLLQDYHSSKLEDGLVWRREITTELINYGQFPKYGSKH